MYELCDFIVENVEINVNKTIGLSILSINDFDDLNKTIDIISQCLKLDDGQTNIYINLENLYKQRATVIYFKYKNRQCEFYMHYDTQRDYIGVRMLPV